MTTELSRLDTIVIEIRQIKRNVAQTTVAGAIAVGQRLQEAKAAVPQGEWGAWLQDNVDYSTRTAENLMALAREYASRDAEPLEVLGVTKAVQLLALPGDEREAFMAQNPVEDMSTRQLKEAIEALKAENAKKQLTIDELLAAPEEASAELEVARKENAALAQEKQQAVDIASNLRAQNAQLAEKAKEHEQEHNRWRDARRMMQQELDAAQKELERTREELQAAGQPIIQQVTPPDVQRELDMLRQERDRKAAAAGNEALIAELRVAFEAFKSALNIMVSAAMAMTDEVRQQYRTAVLQALEIAKRKVEK